MSNDRAILYSSGVAEFEREIELAQGASCEIAVRVRQNELADLLASFEVRGPVRFVSAPNWDGSGQPPTLRIDPQAALPSLLLQLAGAHVELRRADEWLAGVLVGVHEETRGGAGEAWQDRYVVILVDTVIERIALTQVDGLRLTDASLQQELERALRQQIEALRPSAKTLRFELATLEDATEPALARMRYTLPAAAWKISYRLRVREAAIGLAAFAIVDNDGEEDWKDMRITVVAGEPISFTTDLADARRPARKMLHLIADSALGAVEAEEGFREQLVNAAPSMARSRKMRSAPAPARFEAELQEDAMGGSMADLDAAQFSEAQSKEVGDFQIFESEDVVTIEKGRSAAIPLFDFELAESKRVLHFKASEHAERPWRAIEFVYDGDVALGRGVCSVTEEGVFAGNCIIPSLKPGGDALLPHALETGVRVRVDDQGLSEQRSAFVLGAGYLVTKAVQTRRLRYRVRNARDEGFTFLLDHEALLEPGSIICRLLRSDTDQELEIDSKLAHGYRLRFDLKAREELAVEVVEQAPTESSVHVASSGQFEWFFDVFLVEEPGLAARPELAPILTARQELEALRRDLDSKRSEYERIQQRQERLRKNVEVLQRHEHADRWRDELSTSEERLYQLEESEIPELEARERVSLEKLERAIEELSLLFD